MLNEGVTSGSPSTRSIQHSTLNIQHSTFALAPPLYASRPPQPLERPHRRVPPLQRRRPDPVAILDRNLGHAVAHAVGDDQHVDGKRRSLRIPRHLVEHRLAVRPHAAVNVRGLDAVEQPRGPGEDAVGEVVRERHRLRPLGQARGIDEAQAADLRVLLQAFAEDWDSPEMAAYDDYDSAYSR